MEHTGAGLPLRLKLHYPPADDELLHLQSVAASGPLRSASLRCSPPGVAATLRFARNSLLQALYAATLNAHQWPVSLQDLCTTTGPPAGHLVRVDCIRGRQLLACGVFSHLGDETGSMPVVS